MIYNNLKGEVLLLIDNIIIDSGIQSREQLNTDTINEYAEQMTEGVKFPPLTVFYDGQNYWLADGFHRISAYIVAGFKNVEVEIKEGDKRDAILHSVGCNGEHGLRRNKGDKRKAILMLLNDEEWSTWTDVAIAKQCKVDNSYVSKIRKAITLDNPMLEIPTERTYINKYGQTSTMNTSNLSNKPKAKDEHMRSMNDNGNWRKMDKEVTSVYTETDGTVVLDAEIVDDVDQIDVKPTIMIPMTIKLRQMCDVEFIKRWEVADRLQLCSELEMCKVKIDQMLMYLKRC